MVYLAYIPLDKLKLHLGLDTITLTTAETERLQSALNVAVAQVESLTGRTFAPYYATIRHAMRWHNPRELLLDVDLLELKTLTNGDGTPIDIASVELIGSGVLRLLNGQTFKIGVGDSAKPIQVYGIWGWHDDPMQMWLDTGDRIAGEITPYDAQMIAVQDANGVDTLGFTPRFRVGQLLRTQIVTEYMQVLTVDAVNNQLTVLRGQRGTSAISQLISARLYAYQPPAQIESLMLRWAAWLYKTPEWKVVDNTPASLLEEARGYARVTVKS